MRTIHKYPLGVQDTVLILIPKDAKLLTVQMQHGMPCLWAEVDTDKPLVTRMICTHGTGHECRGVDYIATYQLEGLVFHVYDMLEVT